MEWDCVGLSHIQQIIDLQTKTSHITHMCSLVGVCVVIADERNRRERRKKSIKQIQEE